MNRVLLLAGGIGERCRANIPKQFLKLNGKDILLHTILKFEQSSLIDEIYVICKTDWQDYCVDLLHANKVSKFKGCISNGDTCLGSIFNGLSFLHDISAPDDLVLIHDSVRPFIDDALITAVIKTAQKYGNCIPVAKQIETPIMVIDNEVKDTINRNVMYSAKAPQCFTFGKIYDAYTALVNDFGKYCDSAQIAFANGNQLHTVQCEPTNIKITSRMDFYLARALLNCEEDKQFI